MAKKKKKAAPAKIKFQKLVPPLTDKDITPLRAGDRVLITGIIFVARDSAHKIFDKRPPFNIKGAIIYYASPTPTRKGKVIGSIGPTTS
ncbi:MAG: fumarate hydratase C-terminal domain-containing protein, partial [Candidatus Saganbacteria bacterium]|nr:fumarate hydratase C-terminal domain-containing protein [Candidatus Saganbacteria bacterium]